jgi:nicotinamidase/pyrazinamidase
MKRALIIVDVQNDFLPGGPLAVPDGDAILSFVVALVHGGHGYHFLVVTQDWHPSRHGSFASAHAGAQPFTLGELAGLPQMFWPDHCVEETRGAGLAWEIEEVLAQAAAAGTRIFRIKKGMDRSVDSYSAFFDNARRHDTGLRATLLDHGIEEVDIVGLALDYCVKYTALDAASLGFTTRVLLQGSRPVEPTLREQVVAELVDAGVACLAELP